MQGMDFWVRHGPRKPIVFPGADGYAVVADSLQRIVGTPLSNAAVRVALAWSLQNPRLAFRTVPEQRPTLVTLRVPCPRSKKIFRSSYGDGS